MTAVVLIQVLQIDPKKDRIILDHPKGVGSFDVSSGINRMQVAMHKGAPLITLNLEPVDVAASGETADETKA